MLLARATRPSVPSGYHLVCSSRAGGSASARSLLQRGGWRTLATASLPAPLVGRAGAERASVRTSATLSVCRRSWRGGSSPLHPNSLRFSSTSTSSSTGGEQATTTTTTPATHAENQQAEGKQKQGWIATIRDGLHHYWTGSKLLVANVRAAWLLVRKRIDGQTLTRRERLLLTQTTVDLFRLVPFLAIVIIPFAELSLPILLTLFPNMLPSTFEDKIKKEEARRKAVKLKLEMAKFLEDALYMRSLQISSDAPSASAFVDVMQKVKEGRNLDTKEILGLSKLFEDKVTLDSLDRQQIIAMCKYMGLSRFGTTDYLRYKLKNKLDEIREDDQLIAAEGALDKFTEAEMKQATQARGIDYKDFSSAKAQMEQWLFLSAQNIPPSLLILSRAFALTSSYASPRIPYSQAGTEKPPVAGEVILPKAVEEALQKTISSLPEQLVTETKLTSATKNTEDMKTKLEALNEQIQAIKKEEKETKTKTPEKEVKHEGVYTAEQVKIVSEAVSLLFASSPSKIKREREALEQIKERQEERKEEKASVTSEEQSKDKVVNALENKLDKMIAKLDKEMNKIDSRASALMSIVDTNHDGHISFEEFQFAVSHLKAKYTPDDVLAMWRKLDTNHDGQISLEQLEQIYSPAAHP